MRVLHSCDGPGTQMYNHSDVIGQGDKQPMQPMQLEQIKQIKQIEQLKQTGQTRQTLLQPMQTTQTCPKRLAPTV